MKEIVIISGKGGTGKTSFSSSFAYLEGQNAVVCDCDVDAANMHLLLDADFSKKEDFMSGEVAVIEPTTCTNCGECFDVCRFDAISKGDDFHIVDKISCEGCNYCYKICPNQSITMQVQKAGDLFVSNIKNNSKMVHAKLGFAAENSGKLVAKVKTEAKILALKSDREFVITDGSPGVGCPVISSLSGASMVVLVTEVSVSGLHDLKRVHELTKGFNLPCVCIINKYDLNKNVLKNMEEFLSSEGIEVVARVPYDETFTKAMSVAKPVVEFDKNSKLAQVITRTWEIIKERIEK